MTLAYPLHPVAPARFVVFVESSEGQPAAGTGSFSELVALKNPDRLHIGTIL